MVASGAAGDSRSYRVRVGGSERRPIAVIRTSPYEAPEPGVPWRRVSLTALAKIAPRLPGQRVSGGICVWCRRRIRRRHARGPLPSTCRDCAERAYLLRRLRAYLGSSRRYALRLRRRDLASGIERLIAALDGQVRT
jgi:hypothetical protein